MRGNIPDTVGFRGLSRARPVEHAGDELISFLGASYFRALCAESHLRPLGARAALNTAEPGGEEFRRSKNSGSSVRSRARNICHLRSHGQPERRGRLPRIVVTPGADTVTQVKAAVYCRQNPKVSGSPLTSMLARRNSDRAGDIRPSARSTARDFRQ